MLNDMDLQQNRLRIESLKVVIFYNSIKKQRLTYEVSSGGAYERR